MAMGEFPPKSDFFFPGSKANKRAARKSLALGILSFGSLWAGL